VLCGVVWCVWSGVVWSGVVCVEWCSVLWCGVVFVEWCGVVWSFVLWCSVEWCDVCWHGELRNFHLLFSVRLKLFGYLLRSHGFDC